MYTFFDDLVTVNFKDDLYRNIKTIRKSQNLYDDLSNDPHDWEYAIQADINSKPPQYKRNPIINRPFEEALFIQAIAFPFDPKNWAASRYSPGSYGVWYGAMEFVTSIYETVHHWRRFLQAAQFENVSPKIVGERRVFKVKCDALLFDLRKKNKHYPSLIDQDNYTFTQQVGEYFQTQGHPGLLSDSVRCEGVISAIFSDHVLSDPRDYCYLSYHLDTRTQEIRVEREPGNVLLNL